MTTTLPTNINTGDPFYELEDPLDLLQVQLNKKNIDIESLDQRSENQDVFYRGIEPQQLKLITGFVDADPEQRIRSAHVKDLNDYFDKDLVNSDPNYIFRDDRMTRNNINTIRTGIQSFTKNRDMFVTPPPVDTQQKIFELLNK